jgi:hypothetical protein
VRAADAQGNLGGYSGIVSGTTGAAAAGLVGAWGFNEGTGTTAADVSGLVNTGSNGGATWTAAGKFAGALSFNGASALVTVLNAPSLQLSSGMTLEAWVKPSVITSAWRDLIFKDDDNYFLMASSSSGGLPAAGGTFATAFGTGTLQVAPPTWTHLAVTYDRVRLRFYVNGVQVASPASTAAIATSTSPLTIGGDNHYGQFFAGTIDEVRIYNLALTPAQVLADMNAPVERGVVQFNVQRNPATGPVVLSWIDSASNGTYRVRRAAGPTPADFSSATCWVVQGTSFTDPAQPDNGASYDYLVDAGSSCP